MSSRRRRVSDPLRVGLIGCGQIADAHLQEIGAIEGAQVVAVCDAQADLARQAAIRFGVPSHFTSLRQLFDAEPIDVLHITTPPQSHLSLALEALERGVHVYVEKPVTLSAAEARALIDAATYCGRLVCGGYDQLWDPGWIEFQRSIDRGEVGGVVHVEALQRYDLSGPFGRRVLHDPGHWVRLLGGGLLQNIIPHSVCRIASFLEEGAALSVHASWLRRGTDFPSDLHAVFATPGRSATLTFITGASPAGSLFRVHGTKGILELDCRTQTIRSERNGGVPQLLARLSAPAVECRRGAVNFARVGRRLLRGDLRCFAGMGALFAAFYEAIESDGPAPVPYAELLRSIAIMDRLFEACERS